MFWHFTFFWPSCTCWFSKVLLGNNFCPGYSAKFTKASVLEQSPTKHTHLHFGEAQDDEYSLMDVVLLSRVWSQSKVGYQWILIWCGFSVSEYHSLVSKSKWKSWILFFKIKVWFPNPIIKYKGKQKWILKACWEIHLLLPLQLIFRSFLVKGQNICKQNKLIFCL